MRLGRTLGLVYLAVAVSSCGSGASEAESESSSGGEAERPTLHGHMAANFDLALTARDGIISGSLIQTREAAVQLAEQDYSVVLPPDWMPAVERMQSAARELTAVPDLRSGADGVAALAATCGDCHGSFTEGDSGRAVEAPTSRFGASEDMHERMLRHQRAANGFWYGLTVPSETAWRSGAEMLLSAPMAPTDAEGNAVDDKMAKELEEVRELAQRALDAQTTEARTAIYGEFLASCSGCHTGSGS